jgi:hypothetical protein
MNRWATILGLLLAASAAGSVQAQETPAPTPGQPAPAPTPEQPAPAPPQEQPKDQEEPKKKELVIPIAVAYTSFHPVHGDTTSTFGHHWGGIGVTLFKPVRQTRWAFSFDFDYKNKGRGDNEATLVGLTAGLERALGRGRKVLPYASARIGPYYHNLKFNGEHDTGVGFNANAGLGVVFYRRVFLQLQYNYYTSAAGFDFSGWSWTAGVRVFDFKIRY